MGKESGPAVLDVPEQEHISEQGVIDMLDAQAPTAFVEANILEMVGKYRDQCREDAEKEAIQNGIPDADASYLAGIKAQIQVAEIFRHTKNYKDRELSLLEETLAPARRRKATLDLATEIRTRIKEITGR